MFVRRHRNPKTTEPKRNEKALIQKSKISCAAPLINCQAIISMVCLYKRQPSPAVHIHTPFNMCAIFHCIQIWIPPLFRMKKKRMLEVLFYKAFYHFSNAFSIDMSTVLPEYLTNGLDVILNRRMLNHGSQHRRHGHTQTHTPLIMCALSWQGNPSSSHSHTHTNGIGNYKKDLPSDLLKSSHRIVRWLSWSQNGSIGCYATTTARLKVGVPNAVERVLCISLWRVRKFESRR